MKLLLIVLSVSASFNSFGSEKKYFVAGKEMSASAATLASLRGEEEVYKCSAVKAKASKSGSISLKTKETD